MKRGVVLVLSAISVVVAGVAGCSSPTAGSPAPAPAAAPANLAYVDGGATSTALAGIKKAVEASFTFDSTDRAAITKNEQEYLVGGARKQFDQTLASIGTTPVKTQTQVLESGVSALGPRSAKVLAVVSQHSTAPDGKTNAATAVMLISAAPAGGRWQLTDLNFDPRGAIGTADGPGAPPAAATRDSALAAAHRDGAVLLTLDAKNADAVYDRFESVAVDPLLTQFRADRAHTVDSMKQSGASATLNPQSVAALVSATPDGKTATVLLGAIVATQQQTGTQERRVPVRLTLARQPNGDWKVSGIDAVAPAS
ncbi:hypothetical protein VSH64_39905 [Amycolatopsis rhabdoformis]|uniref:Uncharacterized protein n=1 Tax=Amycolatopsis rhabdoformis TaxID=1448059 RepID=A0ABZ1I413_9PSEU|nr:hypothetical protein [Amycolatopsis rhabdoformis]WSE28929.1 hypothetical protein VSH64_39905 [Amycolatopsis rhabdoformis]